MPFLFSRRQAFASHADAMIRFRTICLAGLIGMTFPSGAMAQDIVRLSPEAREAALDAAAQRGEDLPLNGATLDRVHGEMGFMVGSNGSHAVYGSTIVPLGTTGSVALAFSNESYGRRRRH